MSMEAIFGALEKLVELHRSLHHLSFKKTTLLKEDAIEDLQNLLAQERKITQRVERTEKSRLRAVCDWLEATHLEDVGTISEMLQHMTDESDRQRLAHLSTVLTEVMTELKRNEDLNQALLQQSLQFVKLSLDVMAPTLKNMNYGNQTAAFSNNRPLFDSKA